MSFHVPNQFKNPIRFMSSKARRIQAIQDTIREILKLKYGERCQLCGKPANDLGVFHILPVGRYPKIRFAMQNVLISCWMRCHRLWHSDPLQADRFKKKIAEVKGFKTFDALKESLLIYDKAAPRLSAFQISFVEMARREELKELQEG